MGKRASADEAAQCDELMQSLMSSRELEISYTGFSGESAMSLFRNLVLSISMVAVAAAPTAAVAAPVQILNVS